MPKLLTLFAVLALATHAAVAAEAPPSDASIQELFAVTETKKLLDSVYGQMDTMINASVKAAAGKEPLTPAQEKCLDDMHSKMMAAAKESISWEALEPMMRDIYRKSFSQSDVDGMLRFYKSKAGQAVVAKMPLVMQNTMQSVQARTAELIPKLRKIGDDTAEQLKALRQPPDGSASAAQVPAAPGATKP